MGGRAWGALGAVGGLGAGVSARCAHQQPLRMAVGPPSWASRCGVEGEYPQACPAATPGVGAPQEDFVEGRGSHLVPLAPCLSCTCPQACVCWGVLAMCGTGVCAVGLRPGAGLGSSSDPSPRPGDPAPAEPSVWGCWHMCGPLCPGHGSATQAPAGSPGQAGRPGPLLPTRTHALSP